MNKEDLIKKYEGLEGVWDANGAEIARQCFLRDLEQLNEIDTKKVTVPQYVADWIEKYKKKYPTVTMDIAIFNYFKELWNDIKKLDELQRVQVPQIVADYIKYTKDADWDLQEAMDDVAYEDNKDLRKWFNNNIETFARAWIDGYTVEKEKRYLVKIKGIDSNTRYLKRVRSNWIISESDEHKHAHIHTSHTRKELEDSGFGWVFDCPGIEIEEVKG